MNKKVVLVGNQNVGKTSLFNLLSGANQKTGNYPGVTVSKKSGSFKIDHLSIELIDLPGIANLNPTSLDEELVLNYLLTEDLSDALVLFVASAIDLKNSLYLFSQVKDLGFSTALAINFEDQAVKKGIKIDTEKLSENLKCPVILFSARKNSGIKKIHELIKQDIPVKKLPVNYTKSEDQWENYQSFIKELNETNDKKLKRQEAILRHQAIEKWLKNAVTISKSDATDITSSLDKLFLHPFFGYVIFATILLLIFQSVFWIASFPMDWIDLGMGNLIEMSREALPKGMLSDLIRDGLLTGIAGVVIFIPQIAILFFFFGLLEETGYMSRAVFLMDKVMEKVGMNGKSVVPLISSFACAVPSIMATRTIANQKERLITILVAPLITCSARIPVYTVIIYVIIPEESFLGFGLQGLMLFAMYLLGVITTFIAAWVFKKIIKTKYKKFFIIPMPDYLVPNFKNIGYNVWNNTKSFVLNAGKIIVAVTIIIFLLQSYGNQRYQQAEQIVLTDNSIPDEQKERAINKIKSENSYLAAIGQTIEPVIRPLGYDWKMGIGVLASIAAREVFVGTMLVVYGSEEDLEDEKYISQIFAKQTHARTGKKAYNFATGLSLLLFYAFSLQCMSTIAVTYKETQSLKWTAIQFIYMTGLAYIAALIAYQLLK